MKNKKLLYVLIPVTLLIWALIIQKIFAVVSGSENEIPPQAISIPAEDHFEMKDTFSIHTNYRDPFRASAPVKIVSNNPVKAKAPEKNTRPLAKAWPAVIYGGIIKNQKSSKQSVLVSVNGQSNIMKAGEQLNDIQLLRVFKDSIEVKYGNEKRFVSK